MGDDDDHQNRTLTAAGTTAVVTTTAVTHCCCQDGCRPAPNNKDDILHIPDHMDAEWKVVHVCLLHTHIVNADLGVGHTTVVARFGVRLVLDLPVAPRWACVGGAKCMGCCMVAV